MVSVTECNGNGDCFPATTFEWPSNGENSFSTPELWVDAYGYSTGGWRVDQNPRMMADVNRDGLADVVGFAHNGVYVSTSTGSDFTNPQLWVNAYGYNESAGGWVVEHNPRMMADVNGDGLADVVGFAYDGVYVSTSTGSDFTNPQSWVNAYGAREWRVDQHPRMMADLNGHGLCQMFFFITIWYMSLFRQVATSPLHSCG